MFVLFLMYVLSYMDRYLISMLVDPIQADLGLSDLQMGVILGPAFGVTMGLLGLPVAWIADRYSRRWVIFSGVAFWSAATSACGLAASGTALFFARMGVGAGETALAPAANSLLTDKFPAHRLTVAISIFQSGVKVGSAAAFAIGGLIIGATAGQTFHIAGIGTLQPWQLTFIIVGAPGILLGLLVFTFSEPPRRTKVKKENLKVTAILTYLKSHSGLFLLLFGGFTVVSLAAFALGSWVPTYISRRWHLTPDYYGPALGLINLLSGMSMIFKGAIVDWLHGRGVTAAQVRFYSWLLICSTPVALTLFIIPDVWWFLIIYGALQVVTITSMVYFASTLSLLAPTELRAQLLSLAYTLYTLLGLGIGPLAVGALTDYAFGDPDMIGASLGIVLGVAVPLAALLLRLSLKRLVPALAEAARAREEG